MKGKHSKKDKNNKSFKFVYLLLIFFVLIVILGCKNFYRNLLQGEQQQVILNSYDVIYETSIENEKLVLKSNFEENREKRIIYIFEDNVLLEVRILETYINEEEYGSQKEKASKKTGIEIIETNDSELKIYYKRLKLGTDEGLSYQEIYDKYMGIIGAYEII